MSDQYQFMVEPNPDRKSTWRIVRVTSDGLRSVLSQRFNKEHTAQRRAYELQVRAERHATRRIYVGD
jgi:hypothetical protein